MSITHTFQSAKSDGADSTLVQPSNWNAEHTLTGFPLSEMAPAASFTVPAGYGAVIPSPLSLGASVVITLASTAVVVLV